jgi:hypothetical protein
MDWLLDLRPIRLFSFYLAVMFVLSTAVRLRQYHTVVTLVTRLRSRWPNLTALVLAHRHILLSASTLRPLLLMLGLLAANTIASRLIWPQADTVRIAELLEVWPALPFVALAGLAMLCFDIYGIIRVGKIDQAELEKYLDQAEFWLRGWKAPVVRFLSLGYINPRKMVATEVGKALESAGQLLNSSVHWVSLQTTIRFLFGLTLWSSYALHAWLRHLVGG